MENRQNNTSEREPIRMAHQLVETKYKSRQDFIEQAKHEIHRNFNAFVKNSKPDPNEYKAVGMNGVVFGDFPDRNNYNYEMAFDFKDWDSPEKMEEDLDSSVTDFFRLIDNETVEFGRISIHLVHYM